LSARSFDPPLESPFEQDSSAPRPSTVTSDQENPGGFTHIPALDGIRGLAILLVLVDHLFWGNNRTGSALFDLLMEVRGSTYCGVNLFFALSGFLITGILIRTLNVPHYFKTFYSRRALRIFPLYYGFLLALLLLTRPLHLEWSGWQYYYLTYTSNLALWRVHVPLVLPHFNINHFWSLQVEEQFYLIWPLVVYRVREPKRLVRLSLVACGVIFCIRVFLVAMEKNPHFSYVYLPYSPTFSCADNILYGCCLSALMLTSRRETVLRLAPRVFAVLATLLLVAFFVNHGLDWQAGPEHPLHLIIPTVGFSLLGIGSAALIAMVLRPGLARSFFQNGILRFFGRYSYGIYVFHYSITGVLQEPLRSFFNAHFHSKALSVLLQAGIAGGASVLAALVSYHLYEKHFLHLKRYFSYSQTNRGPAL
jgi:peptidoglycan/LPS O-acetylase OafA/YrhL